jgi:hypothetical protein
MSAKTDKALERLAELSKAADQADAAADKARARRDAQTLKAYEAGARYSDLAAAIGRTDDRVGQVLKAERERLAKPVVLNT